MRDVIKSLFYLAGLTRGSTPILSPTLENLEVLEFIQEPLKPVLDKFRILLYIGQIKQEELAIIVPEKGVVKISIKHGSRRNSAGLCMRQNSTYIFELPKELRKRELHVEWTHDNYLLIQPLLSEISESYARERRLIPQHVHRLLKPIVEINVLRDMLEDIRLKVSLALRYLRVESHRTPTAEKRIETPASEESARSQDICSLDEAHCRLTGRECREHISTDDNEVDSKMNGDTEISPVDGENARKDTGHECHGHIPAGDKLVDSKMNEETEMSPVDGENARKDTVKESIISLYMKISSLRAITARDTKVDDEINDLMEGFGDDLTRHDKQFLTIIALLLEERYHFQETLRASVESGKGTAEERAESVAISSAVEYDETSHSADNPSCSNVQQATGPLARPAKTKDTADKRKPTPISSEELERKFLSPEKKRRL